MRCLLLSDCDDDSQTIDGVNSHTYASSRAREQFADYVSQDIARQNLSFRVESGLPPLPPDLRDQIVDIMQRTSIELFSSFLQSRLRPSLAPDSREVTELIPDEGTDFASFVQAESPTGLTQQDWGFDTPMPPPLMSSDDMIDDIEFNDLTSLLNQDIKYNRSDSGYGSQNRNPQGPDL
jgi:hypothetical protein